jgi:hypothetical protein
MMSEARAPSNIPLVNAAAINVRTGTNFGYPMQPVVISLAHIDACETSPRC